MPTPDMQRRRELRRPNSRGRRRPRLPPTRRSRSSDVMSSPVLLRAAHARARRRRPRRSGFDLPQLDPETHRPSGERVRLADFRGRAARSRSFSAPTPDRPSAASWASWSSSTTATATRSRSSSSTSARRIPRTAGCSPTTGRRRSRSPTRPRRSSAPPRRRRAPRGCAPASRCCSTASTTRSPCAYGGWPDRLYLIGRDGRIAFQGEEGPFGFKPAKLAAAIDAELSAPG